MSSVNVSIRFILSTKPTLAISFVLTWWSGSYIGLALKTLNSRYGMLVKIQCMEILATIMDSQISDISIFMSDCISYCSKFSKFVEVGLSEEFLFLLCVTLIDRLRKRLPHFVSWVPFFAISSLLQITRYLWQISPVSTSSSRKWCDWRPFRK